MPVINRSVMEGVEAIVNFLVAGDDPCGWSLRVVKFDVKKIFELKCSDNPDVFFQLGKYDPGMNEVELGIIVFHRHDGRVVVEGLIKMSEAVGAGLEEDTEKLKTFQNTDKKLWYCNRRIWDYTGAPDMSFVDDIVQHNITGSYKKTTINNVDGSINVVTIRMCIDLSE